MKATTRGLLIALVSAGVLGVLAVVGIWVTGGFDGFARAQGPVTVGYDMDPTGNSCPGDGTNCALGTIDSCIEVDVAANPATFSIDVFLEGLPAGDSILGTEYSIRWTPDILDINAQTHTSTTVNLLAQGGAPFDGLGDSAPDTASPHYVAVVDLGDAEYNPPYTHGTLGRYEVTVPTGTPPGFYGLTLSGVTLGRDVPPGGSLCVDYGCEIRDGSAFPQRYGLIAVNSLCSAAPTGTPAPSPTPTPIPTETPSPTTSPTPSPTGTPTPPPIPGPANDDFDDATVIPGLPYSDAEYTCSATAEPGEPNCECASIENSVWYKYTAGADVRLEADTFGSDYDTQLMVYSGPDPATLADLTCVGCNDDTGGPQSRVVSTAEEGATYYFQVDGWGGDCGDLVFSLDIAPPPLAIDLSIEPVGAVVAKTGAVTIGGTVTCSKQAFVELSGDLEQRAGRVIIYSHFSDFLVCAGETPWSAAVVGENGLYKAGPADVSLSGSAFAEEESATAEATATVRLTGSRPVKLCPRGGNDGFEAGVVDTNMIPCWTVVDQVGGWGSWCSQTGTLPPQGPCSGSSISVAAPPEGLQAAMTNQAGPGSHVLYRCGVLRSGPISFDLYVNNEAGVFFAPSSFDYSGAPNQQFRADLVTAAGIAASPFTLAPEDVLLNIYQTLPGHPPVSGYTTVTADAGAYVGQPVCLRFAEVENQWFFHAGVDGVNIDLSPER